MIIFNIEKYGDFDMPYTALVMVAPDGMNKSSARIIAKNATELLKDTNDEQEAVKFLKSFGCNTVKPLDIRIGGNL